MKQIDPTTDGQLAFFVSLVPRASRAEIVGWTDAGMLKVRVTAPPVDNKANQELVRLLSKLLGVTRSDVSIKAGATSRNKRLLVPSECKNRLSSFPDI